jgi:uncharacterized paraquat-inducible protein A
VEEGRGTSSHQRHHHHGGRRRGLAPCTSCGRLIDRRWRRCPLCGTAGAFSTQQRKLVTAAIILAIPASIFALGYLLVMLIQE